ncbi:MAG: hypothetical protein WCA84_10065 [Ignavibacteriaceae bacterium]
MTNQIDTIVKQLAESVTIQSKQANKLWLIMISIAVIVMFPPIMKEGNLTNQIKLPFKIGIVEIKYFYPAVFFLYSILVVAFSTTHTQAIRTQKLAHLALELIENERYYGIYSHDLFDMFRIPGINRTAPLAQFLRGKYQVINHADDCPCWRKRFTSIYYLILKIISSLVYWFLPSYILHCLD